MHTCPKVAAPTTARGLHACIPAHRRHTSLCSIGVLAAALDDTLYLHGGVVCADYRENAVDCVGHVPGRAERMTDMREWVDALNVWKDVQVQ